MVSGTSLDMTSHVIFSQLLPRIWTTNDLEISGLGIFPCKTQIPSRPIAIKTARQKCQQPDLQRHSQWRTVSEKQSANQNRLDQLRHTYHDNTSVSDDFSTHKTALKVSPTSPLFVYCVLRLLLSHTINQQSHACLISRHFTYTHANIGVAYDLISGSVIKTFWIFED